MNAIVIGGGASGMMCAILLAQKGAEVTLIEKNEKLGKKLFITKSDPLPFCKLNSL